MSVTERIPVPSGVVKRIEFVQKIVMNTCPHMDPDGGCYPFIIVEENGQVKPNPPESSPCIIYVFY